MDFMSLLCSDNYEDWLPISEAGIAYSTNHSFPFAPVTPDHAKQFEKPHRSEMRNFSGDESSSQEKDKQENLFTSILSDAAENGCNQLLQDIVDSSSAAISPPLIEKNISELGDNQGIDLNKTPQQKTPKRRKHRPKVIVEGKPKRTPKAPTPNKTNSENPSGKRKYVRKNLGTTSTPQEKDSTNAATIPTAEPPAKSSRRKLDFDFDLLNGENGDIQGNTINIQAENNQGNGTGFYLNFDSQATRLSTGINSIPPEKSTQEKMLNGYSGENQQVQSMFNRTHSQNQMLDESIQFPERRVPAARPTAIRNNAINVIARCVSRNTSFLQRTDSNISEDRQCLQGELNRRFIQANAPTINLETTILPSWKSVPQTPGRDIADYNGNNGYRGPYLNATQQASPSFKDQADSSSWKSTPQKPGRDIADYNGNNGYRGPYLNATQQASPSFKDQADSSFLYQRIHKDHNRIDQISSSRCSETRDRNTILNDCHPAVYKEDSRKVATGELPPWLSTPQKTHRNNATEQASPSFKDQAADSAFLHQSLYRGRDRMDQSSSSGSSETHDRNRVLNNFPPALVKDVSRSVAVPSWLSFPQQMQRDIAVYNENRGFKRPYLNATQPESPSYKDLADLYQGTYKDHSRRDQSSSFKCPETPDRNRVLNDFQPTVVNNDLRKVAMEGKTTVYPSNYVSLPNGRTSNSHIDGDVPKKLKSGSSNSMPAKHFMQNQLIAFGQHSVAEQRPNRSMQVQDTSSTLIGKSTLLPRPLPRVVPSNEQHSVAEQTPNRSTQVQDISSTLIGKSTLLPRPLPRVVPSNEQHSVAEQTPNRSTQVQDISSTLIGKSNLLPPPLPRAMPSPGYKQGTETCPSTTPPKLKNIASTSSNSKLPYADKVLQQVHGNQQIPKKPRGRPKKLQQTVVTIDDTIDEITSKLQLLRISSGSEKTRAEDQTALVLYEGNGKLVPYEDHTKKRKPRPKVDLDPDTNRVWKLLMGKEGSEDTEAPDKDKEKWWENERKVFRGRADSFIARMHLVQGDRRFSRWKGSVVDSVIGVFLTQNVSDHLSSSAFMSLAARFPLQVTSTVNECVQSDANILPKEHKNQIPDLNGTMQCFEETVWQPVYNCPHPSFHEHRTEDTNSTTGRTDVATEPVVTAERNASSSQNSSDSSIHQLNGEFRSSVGSNSEAEDSTCRGRSHIVTSPPILSNVQSSFQVFHNPRTNSLCFDDPSTQCHENQQDIRGLNNNFVDCNFSHLRGVSGNPSDLHMRPGLEAHGTDPFGLFRDENIYSLPSTIYGVPRATGIGFLSRSGHNAQRMGETLKNGNGGVVTQAPKPGPCYPTRDPTHPGSSLQSVPYSSKDQIPLATRQPRTRPTEVVFPGQTGSTHQVSCGTEYSVQAFGEKEKVPVVEKLKPMQTKVVEVNAKEQLISSGETTGTSTNLPNARKGKAEDDKAKSFDWDILRKNVLAEGRIKESSKDAMDSMDYETMRCANVNEISNAIKERGMNNMLAERMKDFLNRLVKDHGSIDLEWLRDVPPDKAKDYLLSIRGLGLKSVECVRLLTLHHLAFPVDTNVGRIAVRLGWVPLQPLPESLQLHLLELYPMLETIQKYLWPRLCKLDQRTLYELHYQMITFGKVFCTKSKPNCNACPMRGECRHFASAFASARLALPGPEDKSIVSSDARATNQKIPVATINPIPLLPACNKEHKEMDSVRHYEPIVEEPATPEPEAEELSLSDIEDAFYEDPDEIPTIRLNVEEFAMNLHNYMQENMELQEGDMSKALVALNPEAPSIPTQKLKNVSRLRTEHQVYELPDSHPLLEGLDKREPDDPSPYLLAIWTPGETPNSIQPPESGCEFQESGKLCDKSTCFSCNSVKESNSQTVRGTILVPCRTAMRGSFPLNGTYFQVNEVFADHESSLNPINVPRALIWNLPRRTVYFGTSVSTIFKGLSVEGIQFCFWKGFVCVRGFDQKSRAPRPLKARLHFPASKLQKRQ